MDTSKLTPVIGIEIHVELNTKSKMFCGCKADHFQAEPNTQTCPVCLGMPGALPVPNKQAIDWAIMIGLGLNCTIAKNSKFDRKHYFYPDLPKGYQISQYDEPLCQKGTIDTKEGEVKVTRVHLEEDTAKLQHTTLDGKKVSLVDFNRSSVPLVEIVSEPDVHSANQAKEYAQKIQQLVRFLEVSDADMEKGSMRVEANISWGLDLGYKVEVKNINSFRFMAKAIDYELNRQKELLEKDVIPDQETRGWNESKNCTYTQRSKEDAKDYRYFPDPDIPPLIFSQSEIDAIQKNMPKLPEAIKTELINDWKVRPDYAETVIANKQLALDLVDCLKLAKAESISTDKIMNLIINKKMNPRDTEEIFKQIKKESNGSTLSPVELENIVTKVIKDNPEVVTKYKQGKTSVIGALIGQVMRESKGQADPKIAQELTRKQIGA